MVIMADVGVAKSKQGRSLESATLTPRLNQSERSFKQARGGGMALPKVVLRGRRIILLSGFKDGIYDEARKRRTLVVDAEEKLRKAAKENPDAVAFGYVAGQWVASA
jgi:hypothetical protein